MSMKLLAIFVIANMVIWADAKTYFVAASRSDNQGSGTSWTTAKKTIQAAIDLTIDGDTVLVTNGIYSSGVRITPGFSLNNRVVITNNIIVKSVNGADVTVIEGSGTEYYGTTSAIRCVFLSKGTLIGFTLRKGATLHYPTYQDGHDHRGGGILMDDWAQKAELRNSIVESCKATAGGGAASGRVVNSVFWKNNVTQHGGAMYDCIALNTTASMNQSGAGGSGTAIGWVVNSIIWGNTLQNGATNNVQDSIVVSSCAVSNPLFVNATQGDFHLLASSPCKNAGNNTYVFMEQTDADGKERITDGKVDIGAYEIGSDFPSPRVTSSVTYFVDASRPDDSGEGITWASAKKTIQAAVKLTVDGDTVLVTNGIYNSGVTATPGFTLNNRVVVTNDIVIRSVNGPQATIIEGSGTEHFGTTSAVRCVYLHKGILDGFTLRKGATLSYPSYQNPCDHRGGGIMMGGAPLGAEIRNSIVEVCKSTSGGGAADGRVVNSLFWKNTCIQHGGAVWDGVAVNITAASNQAGFGGGGTAVGRAFNSIINGNSLISSGSENNIQDTGLIFSFTGNPLFSDSSTGDFRLQPTSPCINKGNNFYATDSTDLLGTPRIQNGTVDMGAYETAIVPIQRGVLRLQKPAYSVAEDSVTVTLKAERIEGNYGTASVSFVVDDGTATAGVDYSADPYTLTWNDGQTGTKSIYIEVFNDDVYEGNETFTIRLVNATGASMGEPAEATVTIVDDEGVPSSIPRFSGNLEFGEVTTNTLAMRTVDVWNDGNQTLSVTNVVVPSGFSVMKNVFTVPAGEAVSLSVWFSPVQLMAYNGLLTLGCAATDGMVSLAVSGTGVVPPPSSGMRTITGTTAVIAIDVPEGAEVFGVEDELSQGLIPVWISDGGTWDAVTLKVKWFFNEPGQVRDRALQYRVSSSGSVVKGLVNFGSGNLPVTGDTVFVTGGDQGLLHPADDNGDWHVVLSEVSASVSRWMNGLDDVKTPVVVRGITLYRQGELYAYDAQVSAEAKRWIPIINPMSMAPLLSISQIGTLSDAQASAVRIVQTTNVTVIVTPVTGTSAWGLEESVPAGMTVAGISGDGIWDSNNHRIKWAFFDGDARTLSYRLNGSAGTNVTVAGTVSFDGSEDLVTGASVVTVPLTFSTWAKRKGLVGETDVVFHAMNADYGQPNGLVYAFGSNFAPGDLLLGIGWSDGVPIIETPVQDPSTLTTVAVSLEWAADLTSANWSSGLVPAADQSGVPINRCRWIPLSAPDKAFYRLRAVLK